MAVGCQGIIHYQVLDGSCKKLDFVNFVACLPSSVTGKTLVMDNLRCHHSKETLLEIERLGCRALYIPPYSPRFNAIEYVFSTLKRQYRQACSELVNPISGNVDQFVDVLEGCLIACGGFKPFFTKVRKSVQMYFDNGEFIRYD